MNSTRRSETYFLALSLSLILILVQVVLVTSSTAASLELDERPAAPGEWGYHPADRSDSQTDPPSFSWRPENGLRWEVECLRGGSESDELVYGAEELEFNVHCPPSSFGPGRYAWRYRGQNQRGDYTNWSQVRTFQIAADVTRMPLPPRHELLSRIPESHPRLFLRPESLPQLRQLAGGAMQSEYEQLVRQCERLVANPPPTGEPPKYPPGMERKSEAWRKIWWGNRSYTIKALDGAATLAFTRLLGGQEQYGHEAKRILLECAAWDPVGSTGFRYNDEAGMPYSYYFARTYSFVNDLLTDEEREICRAVMKVRGDEMYQQLCPRHLWKPYSSHSNRAWHFLGEVGIAFLGEVEGAEDWVWFATNVFFNTYPAWSDEDGGWHEGSSYWSSYIGRFTWWADAMREAMGINAYEKPYFSQIGYYAMYLLPPGKSGGGFGDLTANKRARNYASLMGVLAAQAQNPHWQWYVEQLGGAEATRGYLGFLRGQLPRVQAKAPDELPTSRLFAGTGQAYLNTQLTDASESVQVAFKSSPFGTQSHGYESNNSFLLWAYGKRLLIRSGYRDIYGSKHHQDWMWSTRSTNCITINGHSQRKHTPRAAGKITAFETTPTIDLVVGDASDSYEAGVERFTRAMIFVKPDTVIVYDRLKTSEPATFEYWLHAVNEFDVQGSGRMRVRDDDVVCEIAFLTPQKLAFTQTREYDPNPRPRISLREWHVTARTEEPRTQMEFLVVYRPQRAGTEPSGETNLEKLPGGYVLTIGSDERTLTALLPTDDDGLLEAEGLRSEGVLKLKLDRPGQPPQILEVREDTLEPLERQVEFATWPGEA